MQNACIAEATKLGACADEFRTKSSTDREGGLDFLSLPGPGGSWAAGPASRAVTVCLCCRLLSPHRWAADREQRGDGPGQVRVRGQQQRRGALLVPS